ncbi:MAG: lipid IV(A) 3-deoxy-D-manno-octulosonic acid transferase [Gammaproteobacteria bacterium]|nr:lipid IV(A) 3-deoxy-D-manno-octulosonic acid transferase [Gammaproteobacteria bacterium]MCP5459508.1 lipid IV(A) 3-deoxy-D-manno-octulosonic acid transferase [Gammaproteobacteria bacterium]
MRRIYSLLLYALLPLILLRLYWRGHKNPDYRRRWAERFGYFPALPGQGYLWVHAVSVGETRAALPLIRALLQRYPNHPVLVTTTTPTGSQQVRSILRNRVKHVYLPYDMPGAVARFLTRARPILAVIMETELWPNLFRQCAMAGIPLVVANARLSPRSARHYGKLPGFTAEVLTHTTLIAAQGESDAAQFRALGAPRVRVVGNLKYDLTLPPGLPARGRELRRMLGENRPVWIAASTHSGEDEQVLDAFSTLRARFTDMLLLLVPRHPERFTPVALLCERRGLNVVRRSEQRPCTADTAVYLGDSMGELLLFYSAADIAFVGGSLIPQGGHNPLEAALLGLPVLLGPHLFNFAEISQSLLSAHAAWQVADAKELAQAVAHWLDDEPARQEAGQRAKALLDANRGALDALLDCINGLVRI